MLLLIMLITGLISVWTEICQQPRPAKWQCCISPPGFTHLLKASDGTVFSNTG